MFLTSKSYGDTDFITGMRALAAIAVLFIHSGGAGLRDFGEMANNFVDLGKSGVYVFFVISGFSVAQSLASANGYLDYLNKRIWRIAPLYYFWIFLSIAMSVTAVYWQGRFAAEIDAYNLLMHLGFVSYLDYRIANSILGVEWSIPIEVFWYLFMPLLLLVSRSKFLLLLMVAASAALHIVAEKHAGALPVPANDAALAIHWSPLPYLFNFCLGVAAFRLRDLFSKSGLMGDSIFCLSAVSVFVYCAYPAAVQIVFRDEFFFMSWLSFALIVFGTSESFLFRNVMACKALVFLGTISYGIYLCHMPIINLISKIAPELSIYKSAFFVVITVGSCCVSLLTYHVIEKPGGSLGRKIARLPVFSKAKVVNTPA